MDPTMLAHSSGGKREENANCLRIGLFSQSGEKQLKASVCHRKPLFMSTQHGTVGWCCDIFIFFPSVCFAFEHTMQQLQSNCSPSSTFCFFSQKSDCRCAAAQTDRQCFGRGKPMDMMEQIVAY